MAFEPRTWVDGAYVTPEEMSRIERGVDEAHSASPTSLAVFGVLPAASAAVNVAGFAAAVASGLTSFYLPAGTYSVQLTDGGTLMNFVSKKGVRIIGDGAILDDTTTFTNNGPLTTMFKFDACEDVEVRGIKYIGPVLGSPTTLLGYQGATFVRAINATKGVVVNARIENARYGVQSGEYGDATKGGCSGFDLTITGSMVGYPIALYLADNVRHDLDVDGVHRVAYMAGVDGFTGVARWRDQYIAATSYLMTDALTSGTDAVAQVAPPANPTTSRGCSNGDITVIDKGSTVFQNASVCAGIALSRVDPCRYANLKIKVYTVGTDTVSTKVGGFHLTSTGIPAVWSRYAYNWEPTVVLDNISISGVVDHSAQAVAANSTGELYIYTKDDAGEGSGKYATVRNLVVNGLTVLKSSAGSPRALYVIAREPQSPIELRGIYAPGLPMALHTSSTVPTLFERCVLSAVDASTPSPGAMVTLGRGNIIDAIIGNQPVRTGGNVGIGGAGGVITTVEKTLTLSGASTTWTAAIPSGSKFLGMQGRIQTTITGATGYQAGVSGDVSRFANRNDLTAGLTFTPAAMASAVPPEWYLTNTDVIITAKTSNFTGGSMRLILSYVALTAPTS